MGPRRRCDTFSFHLGFVYRHQSDTIPLSLNQVPTIPSILNPQSYDISSVEESSPRRLQDLSVSQKFRNLETDFCFNACTSHSETPRLLSMTPGDSTRRVSKVSSGPRPSTVSRLVSHTSFERLVESISQLSDLSGVDFVPDGFWTGLFRILFRIVLV